MSCLDRYGRILRLLPTRRRLALEQEFQGALEEMGETEEEAAAEYALNQLTMQEARLA